MSAYAAASIDEGRFARVRHMMTALENFEKAGLPCFQEGYHLTAGEEEEAYDFRNRNWGAGRRAVVEMAYVWE